MKVRRGEASLATNYKTLFIIGITWIPLGLALDIPSFWIIGIVFMIVGMANKDKWDNEPSMTESQKKLTTWLLIVGVVVLVAGVAAYFFSRSDTVEITNFEQCIEAGNPAMESHPRQCRDPKSDKTFTEIIEEVPIQPIDGGNCDDYTFSSCPAGCVPRCISSGGDSCNQPGVLCTTDCEGPGSCAAK